MVFEENNYHISNLICVLRKDCNARNGMCRLISRPGLEVIKLFSIFNSTENKINIAHKCLNDNNW